MTERSARAVLPGAPVVPWQPWGDYSDILLDRCSEGIARGITMVRTRLRVLAIKRTTPATKGTTLTTGSHAPTSKSSASSTWQQ